MVMDMLRIVCGGVSAWTRIFVGNMARSGKRIMNAKTLVFNFPVASLRLLLDPLRSLSKTQLLAECRILLQTDRERFYVSRNQSYHHFFSVFFGVYRLRWSSPPSLGHGVPNWSLKPLFVFSTSQIVLSQFGKADTP